MNKHHKTHIDIKEEEAEIKAAMLNPTHFNVLYERYFKGVYVFIYRRTENEELSADLCSQVFLRAMVNIKKYKFKGLPFSSWLFRIALNEVNMYYRKHNKNRIVSIEKTGIVQMVEETENRSNEEALQRMTKCLSLLKMEDLELIELRYFEKYSFAEISTIKRITVSNAKIKTYRIIDKLKKLMKR